MAKKHLTVQLTGSHRRRSAHIPDSARAEDITTDGGLFGVLTENAYVDFDEDFDDL